MSRRTPSRKRTRKKPPRRKRRSRLAKRLEKRLPSQRTRRRMKQGVTRGWRGAPRTLRWGFVITVGLVLWLGINGVYQVARKPSELFFPVSGALHKTPTETWSAYAALFRAHSTDVMTPDLLAALAQVEASGNPVARTYWRWSFSFDPFSIYRPASSAVGMYQFTDGTFEEARRYCIHDHAVAEAGAWKDFDSCWFNALYSRLLPSHAIELTSAYLDRRVADTLQRHPRANVTLRQKQQLATLIHLCGAGAGAKFAKRGLQLAPRQRCGSHDLRRYLAKVAAQQAGFVQLAVARSTED